MAGKNTFDFEGEVKNFITLTKDLEARVFIKKMQGELKISDSTKEAFYVEGGNYQNFKAAMDRFRAYGIQQGFIKKED